MNVKKEICERKLKEIDENYKKMLDKINKSSEISPKMIIIDDKYTIIPHPIYFPSFFITVHFTMIICNTIIEIL